MVTIPVDMVFTGQKVIELRKARLLSQRDLAARAGVSVVTVRAVEKAYSDQPHAATMRKLADALGVDPLDLGNPALSAVQVLRRAERQSGDEE